MSSAKGYILLARAVGDSEVAKMSPCTRELWTYLLRMVNYADNGRTKRGQGFFNLEQIQTDLEWWVGYRRETYSKPEITKALRRLREGCMIETTKEVRGIVVTICKYDYYQDPENYEGNAKETRRKEHRATPVRTISEEEKKKRREEEKESARALVWPTWAGPKTLEAWAKFSAYRLTDHKATYKSITTEQHAVDRLTKWFPSGPQFVSALTYAMARNWVFPVDPAEHKYPAVEDSTPKKHNPRA